ncbi:MAG TPA: glycosyltransferase family 4 protein, partial [Fibrobacteria bacterium]|nr:glycosyltransferase family 4 protein [Fibrobacteria bacterium]
RDACEGNPAIRLLENIPDVSRFYADITVFVNAVREGRGLRTKVVEAAAFGRPIVSTPLGAEGLESFRMPIFNDVESLAQGLRTLEDVGEWRKAAHHNRSIVEAGFSVRSIGTSLMDLLAP